jgi:hypothetical protein
VDNVSIGEGGVITVTRTGDAQANQTRVNGTSGHRQQRRVPTNNTGT